VDGKELPSRNGSAIPSGNLLSTRDRVNPYTLKVHLIETLGLAPEIK